MFGDFDQKHTSGDVLVLKSLVAEGLLELVKLHQFHGQRALQERVSVKLDRVMIERCVHFRDRAAVIPGNASHAFLDDLVVIHGTSLPLMLGLANTDAALEVADDRAHMLDQAGLFGADHREKLLVIGAAAAPPTRRQGREGSGIAIPELPAQALYATDAWRLLL